MTKFLKKDQLSSNWYEIDAKNAVVGRLATVISKIIRGKISDFAKSYKQNIKGL